jgi:hypothetical protein
MLRRQLQHVWPYHQVSIEGAARSFSVLAALILFLGIAAIRAYAAMGASGDS